jgi:hypothetical protein
MDRTALFRALPPADFRFTDPGDQGKFGDRWFTYDEAAWLRLPARELIMLEADLGMTLVSAMNGFRMSSVLGDTAVTWLGVRALDPALAGEFDAYNPITMAIEWRAHVEPEGKDEPATDGPVDSGTPVAGSLPPTISGQTDTVALPIWPAAE